MSKSQPCLIGPHASISKGILNAIKYAEYIGGNTLQIFLGSNQTTSLKMKTKITEEQIEEVRQHLKKSKTVLVIHTVYLLNFCNHPPSHPGIKFALDNLIYDIKLTQKLGGIGCVLHLGYQKELDSDEAYKNMVDNVKYAIDQTKDCPDVKIILETPAGQGSQIATNLKDFAKIWNAFPKSYYSRLGSCVDTAHIFSAGRDISTVEGTKAYFKEYDKLIGLKNLTVFHINDSKVECNTRKDKHEGLGDGYIYDKDKGGDLLALKEIHSISRKYKIPMVLETHGGGYYGAAKDMGRYAQEIALFRGWDEGKSPHRGFKLVEKDIKPPPKTSILAPKPKSTKPKKKSKKSKKKSPSNQVYKTFKTNSKIIDIFNKLSQYYKMESNHIRKNAYDKAVYELKRFPSEITSGKDVKDIKGVGKKMMDKIDEIIETGTLKTLQKLEKEHGAISTKKEEPHLKDVLGFGAKKVLQIKELFNITTPKQLLDFIKDKSNFEKLSLTNQQLVGLKYHNDLSSKVKRSEAEKIFKSINTILTKAASSSPIIKSGNISVELAGSFASKKTEQSKDIDILICAKTFKSKKEVESSNLMKEIITILEDNNIIKHTLSTGKSKFLGLVSLEPLSKNKMRHLDIRLVDKNSYIFAKLYYTSGAMFNKIMRTEAKKNDMKLNEWGLYEGEKKTKLVSGIKSEEDIFKKIKMDFVPLDERR